MWGKYSKEVLNVITVLIQQSTKTYLEILEEVLQFKDELYNHGVCRPTVNIRASSSTFYLCLWFSRESLRPYQKEWCLDLPENLQVNVTLTLRKQNF